MSDEQMEEQSRRGPLESVGKVAEAALAVGAGAALFYRGGGSRFLSNGFRRASQALNESIGSISTVALHDMNISQVRGFVQSFRTAYQNADDRISLNLEDSNSVLNAFVARHQMNTNPRAFLQRLYDDEMIKQPLKQEFQNNFGRNGLSNQKINMFVDDVMKHQDEAFTYIDDADQYVFDEHFLTKHFSGTDFSAQEQGAMMDRMLQAIQDRRANFEAFRQQREPVVRAVTDKLGDVRELGSKFGFSDSSKFGKQFKDFALGDRAATLNDLLQNRHLLKNTSIPGLGPGGEPQMIDVLDMIERDMQNNPAMGNLLAGDAYRVNAQGELLGFEGLADVKKKVADNFANTLPGKLFKMRDILGVKNAPNIAYFGIGKADPMLVALAEGRDSTLTSNSYVRILNKAYRINRDGIEHVEALDNTYLASGQHGTLPRLMKNMSGDVDHRTPRDGGFMHWADLGSTTQPTKLKEFMSFFTKLGDERWGRNMFSRFLNPDPLQFNQVIHGMYSQDHAVRGMSEQYIGDYFDRLRKVDKFFSQTTKQLDRATVQRLHGATQGEAQRIFGMLQMNDQDLLRELMSQSSGRFQNPTLRSLINRYMRDAKQAADTKSIVSDKLPFGETRAVHYTEMLRKELAKEGLLSYANRNGHSALLDLFQRAGIEGQALKETKYLANWAVLQDVSGINIADRRPLHVEDLKRQIVETQMLFSGQDISGRRTIRSEYVRSFQENVRQMSKEHSSVFQEGFQRDENLVPGNSFGEWMFMQKSTGVKDILQNLNMETMQRAAKQLVAGRKDMSNVTTATMIPYFFLYRLSEPLNSIGLGFSARSMGSVGDLAANIMLKRVMPIAAGLTALSYLDYTSKQITGTSLKGAAANALGNFDLFNRRIMDATGVTGWMKDQYALNPMDQYWKEQEPMSYDERKKWYENGYSPVRKGRWWSFGSASEYRGGKIDYYQPNYVRRANSDWYDISVYGSVDEKWAHSWIPTPQHPLAPIRRLLDPYWLERKHYWDRPYPVTGKMFEESSPWGAVLNPTVGAILKPQQRMHQSELGGTLVDVRDLIAQHNRRHRDKANEGLVRVEGNTFTPVSYSPLGDPTGSLALGGAEGGGAGASAGVLGGNYTALDFNQYDPVHDAIQARAVSLMQGAGGAPSGNLSLAGQIRLGSDRGDTLAGVMSKVIPMDILNSINAATKSRAAGPMLKPKGGNTGVVVNDPIFSAKASSMTSYLNNPDLMSDLRNVGSTKDMLQDAGYSIQELGGMYGFMFEEIMPGRKRYKLQSADRMSSFSRKFWDASLGGNGGEFMEIARRFFPHEDHSIERLNPIRNTMPEWMPERFKHGDPYQMLPKGEMRLPGAGYEDMYKLHPDAYGRYGAFDRMKILGDIAPWSKEYRLWRDVAQKTVKDPLLKDEMKQIKQRVKEQSKQHDFYDYKFLGQELEEHKVTIDKVDGKNFTVIGNNQTYKLAGIKLKDTRLQDVLQPGMEVRIKHDINPAPGNTISAIVMTGEGSLNRKLLRAGQAEATDDPTVAGAQARFTPSQVDRGKFYELIAHAPIPYLHSKFMRVNSPLESYKQEQIHGTSYATWSHPIQGFIVPAFQKAFSISEVHAYISESLWRYSEQLDKSAASNGLKALGRAAFLVSSPGAFAGSMAGLMVKLDTTYMKAGGRIGATVGMVGTMLVHNRNPIHGTIEGAILGQELSHFFEVSGKRGAAIGAISGLALSMIQNPRWDKDRILGDYIPNRVKKRWEVEEYFDRLKYIKYTGLYEKAARKAKWLEGVDIRKIVNKYERDAEQREKIKNELLAKRQLISNTYAEGDSRRAELLAEIDEKMQALSYPQTIVKAGKYTKAALAYKQAAESTVYGLKRNASWSQILRAVPKYERDYMLEFSKERDPEKRKEILEYIAPYRRRILQLAWGEEPDKVKDNTKFFATHKLPGLFWSGWKPGVDLDNVEIKTIKNEGMLLSDFGFYDSQAQTQEAQAAPDIDMNQATGPVALRKNLMAALSGAGLIGVNVDIEPSSQPGLQMIADIVRIGDHHVREKINGVLGRLF